MFGSLPYSLNVLYTLLWNNTNTYEYLNISSFNRTLGLVFLVRSQKLANTDWHPREWNHARRPWKHSKWKTSQACFTMWSPLQTHKEKLHSCPSKKLRFLRILGQKGFLQCHWRIGHLTRHDKFYLNWVVIKLCPLSGNDHLKYTLASVTDVA